MEKSKHKSVNFLILFVALKSEIFVLWLAYCFGFLQVATAMLLLVLSGPLKAVSYLVCYLDIA